MFELIRWAEGGDYQEVYAKKFSTREAAIKYAMRKGWTGEARRTYGEEGCDLREVKTGKTETL